MKIKKAVLVVIVFLGSLSFGFSQKAFEILNKDDTVSQGDVLVIKMNDQLSPKRFLIYAFDRFCRANKDNMVFIGIDLAQEPGFYPIAVVDSLNNKEVNGFLFAFFGVKEKEFPHQNAPFKIRKPSKKESQKRLEEEKVISNAFIKEESVELTNNWENWKKRFSMPLKKTESTGVFGTKRLYKKTIVGRHRGEDLKAKEGTPVYSIQDGSVVLARKFSLEGNMVIINHGFGTYSLYMHFSKFSVKEGQKVEAGQIIGLSGKTGRVSGPHLHFAVKINGANVDPLNFINIVHWALPLQ